MPFGMPKLGDLTTQLNSKFDEMMLELKAIRNVLMQILAEQQKQTTPEPKP